MPWVRLWSSKQENSGIAEMVIPMSRYYNLRVRFNDLESAAVLINDQICAVIVEAGQDEGGMVPVTVEFLQRLCQLCDKHQPALIFDELQTGVGHTGELYAYMHYAVIRHLLSTAKALGGGFPLASAVSNRVLALINTDEVLDGVKQRHHWLIDHLQQINKR